MLTVMRSCPSTMSSRPLQLSKREWRIGMWRDKETTHILLSFPMVEFQYTRIFNEHSSGIPYTPFFFFITVFSSFLPQYFFFLIYLIFLPHFFFFNFVAIQLLLFMFFFSSFKTARTDWELREKTGPTGIGNLSFLELKESLEDFYTKHIYTYIKPDFGSKPTGAELMVPPLTRRRSPTDQIYCRILASKRPTIKFFFHSFILRLCPHLFHRKFTKYQ